MPVAVLRGFLWDNGLSILGAMLLAAFLVGDEVSDPDEAGAVLATVDFALYFLPIGIACTVYGGFVAASSAGQALLKNAVAVGVADVVVGLLGMLLPANGPLPPLWLDLLGFGLVIPAAALGGWWALRRSDPAT